MNIYDNELAHSLLPTLPVDIHSKIPYKIRSVSVTAFGVFKTGQTEDLFRIYPNPHRKPPALTGCNIWGPPSEALRVH